MFFTFFDCKREAIGKFSSWSFTLATTALPSQQWPHKYVNILYWHNKLECLHSNSSTNYHNTRVMKCQLLHKDSMWGDNAMLNQLLRIGETQLVDSQTQM